MTGSASPAALTRVPEGSEGAVARLTGTLTAPEIHLRFARNARHPATGEPLTEWVKKAPRRRWDPIRGCWIITAFGWKGLRPPTPIGRNNARKMPAVLPQELPAEAEPRRWPKMLREAGFTLTKDPLLADVHPSVLMQPLVLASTERTGTALVYPRLGGWDLAKVICGGAAVWKKETDGPPDADGIPTTEGGYFAVPLSELLDPFADVPEPKQGLDMAPEVLRAAADSLMLRPERLNLSQDAVSAAAYAASSSGLNLTGDQKADIDLLVEAVGDIPDWFGLALYPYQRLGALSIAAGHEFLADSPGLGKTRQLLAAFALRNVQRGVLIVPPVAITSWTNETTESGLASIEGAWRGESHDEAEPYRLVVFKAGRKEPDLPQRGIVIVPDSLIAGRPALLNRIAGWQPDAAAYDEAHRARTWTSARAVATRDLASAMAPTAVRIPATGTPLFKSPADLASLLEFSGQLQRVFGGYSRFVGRYCKRDRYNQLIPNEETLEELHHILRTKVWVRRNRDEVLADLPKKARYAQVVDVDLADYRKAHAETIETISAWVEEFLAEHECYPDEEAITAYAKTNIGLVSPLRKAAGVAKVPVVVEKIEEWLDSEWTPGVPCDRPLLVWVHHQPVMQALAAAVHAKMSAKSGGKMADVAIIDGSTSADERGRLTAQFQAGNIPVMLCSITAAGVAITLTRGNEAIFVETDWSPNIVSQAEDRQSRIGQTRPTSNTFLIAEGTLDAHIQSVLEKRSKVIREVTGDSLADVAVLENAEDSAGVDKVVIRLVNQAVLSHQKAAKKKGPAQRLAA